MAQGNHLPILSAFSEREHAIRAAGSLRDAGIPAASIAVVLPEEHDALEQAKTRLVSLGIPEEVATWCHGELQAGHTLVAVRPNGRRDDCLSILRQRGGVESPPQDVAQRTEDGELERAGTMELRGERIIGDPIPVQAGAVIVRKVVEEVPVVSDLTTESDVVTVGRVPVNEVVAERRQPWQEDDTLVIPIYEEILVAERRLVMVEQLHVRRTSRTQRHEVSGTVRRERVVIEDPGEFVRELPNTEARTHLDSSDTGENDIGEPNY